MSELRNATYSPEKGGDARGVANCQRAGAGRQHGAGRGRSHGSAGRTPPLGLGDGQTAGQEFRTAGWGTAGKSASPGSRERSSGRAGSRRVGAPGSVAPPGVTGKQGWAAPCPFHTHHFKLVRPGVGGLVWKHEINTNENHKLMSWGAKRDPVSSQKLQKHI